MADAGDVAGKGWLNWTDCELFAAGAEELFWPWGAMDWIVVRVVVSDRTEGAGLENVLSPPRRESIPPPIVRLVPATELVPWLSGAMVEPSFSVENVPATLLPAGLPFCSAVWLVVCSKEAALPL